MKNLFILGLLLLVGCATAPPPLEIKGEYQSKAKQSINKYRAVFMQKGWHIKESDLAGGYIVMTKQQWKGAVYEYLFATINCFELEKGKTKCTTLFRASEVGAVLGGGSVDLNKADLAKDYPEVKEIMDALKKI